MIRAVIFDMYETLVTHYQSQLYFGAHMAEDAGIPTEEFLELWTPTENARTIGKMTLREALEIIFQEKQCRSDDIMEDIINKRVAVKKDLFRHLHPEIIQVMCKLKERGILIGLISNCFSEEAEVIRQSELFPYFDAVCLSYEQGIAKPDREIFIRCMDKLSVNADECLYVGDGGSYELESANCLGMTAVQAVWYFSKENKHSKRKSDFAAAEHPLDVLNYLDN